MKTNMIKLTVLYPNGKGKRFDLDYYCHTHIPMVLDLLRPEIKGSAVDKCLTGETPDAPPAYIAVGHLYFSSPEGMQKVLGPNMDKIAADLPNYTDIEPEVLVSQVMMDKEVA